MRPTLRWVFVGCVMLAVAGLMLYHFSYRSQAHSKQSEQLLPATKILRSAVEVAALPSKPLPRPQTLFEAADGAFTTIERLDFRLDMHKSFSPLLVAMIVQSPSAYSSRTIDIDAYGFRDINAFVQSEWHVDFINSLVLYERLRDNTTQCVPRNLRGMIKSDSILKAAYDGNRWVIINDVEVYHPNRLPERGWRYHVLLLRNYEEGIPDVDGLKSAEYLLPLFGLHRAYLFAKNNIRSLLEIDKLASVLNTPQGWELRTEGIQQIEGYECYRVRATNQQMQSAVWLWFCPSLQYRCIRAEAVSGNNRQSSRFVTIAEIPEWTKQDSQIPLPKRLRVARYVSTAPSSSDYVLLDKSDIVVHYLSPVADTAYRLAIPSESAYVSDNIANRVYTLGKQVPIAPRQFPWWFLGVLMVFLLALGGIGVRFYRRRRTAFNG